MSKAARRHRNYRRQHAEDIMVFSASNASQTTIHLQGPRGRSAFGIGTAYTDHKSITLDGPEIHYPNLRKVTDCDRFRRGHMAKNILLTTAIRTPSFTVSSPLYSPVIAGVFLTTYLLHHPLVRQCHTKQEHRNNHLSTHCLFAAGALARRKEGWLSQRVMLGTMTDRGWPTPCVLSKTSSK